MMEGSVVKIIDNATAKVLVIERSIHPLYKKVLNKKKYFLCQIGGGLNIDENSKVEIIGCKPYSKMKKHIIVKVI